MSKKTLRNLIIASIFLVTSLAIFGFMMFGVESNGRLLQKQIATVGAEKSQEESFYRLQRTAEESAADREHLVQHFLKEESDTIDLLTQIESLAPKVGVVNKTEGLQKITDKATGASWIEINLAFSGNEVSVDEFVRVLENLPYMLRITSLDLSTQSSSLWSAKVTLRVYVLNYDT